MPASKPLWGSAVGEPGGKTLGAIAGTAHSAFGINGLNASRFVPASTHRVRCNFCWAVFGSHAH